MAAAPEDGVEYPLAVGASFASGEGAYTLLRYEFMPASVDATRAGTLELSAEGTGASARVRFDSTAGAGQSVAFEGSHTREGEEAEAVLIFDGRGLRLEAIGQQVLTLRVAGQARVAKPPPAPRAQKKPSAAVKKPPARAAKAKK